MAAPQRSTYTGMGFRKSHQKSRLGCSNCKKRRIKCDERKPECSNCSKSLVKCDFTSSLQYSSPSYSASPGTEFNSDHAASSGSSIDFEWGIKSLELLHNYSTSTCYTLSDIPAMQTFMRIDVPQVGFHYNFILHEICALSALHMARFKTDQAQFFHEQADHHHEIGLRTASSLLPKIDTENCHALYLFASLCCSFALAKGPKQGDFILFGDGGISEWLTLFRGIKPIFELHSRELLRGVLAPMFRVGIKFANQTAISESEPPFLTEVREYIAETAADEGASRALLAALEGLSPYFSMLPDESGRQKLNNMESVGPWLYRLPDDFISLLQQQHPAALVIWAYFCVLLNDCSTNWIINGWPDHLLRGIYTRLPREYLAWIRWPIEQVGWIPQ